LRPHLAILILGAIPLPLACGGKEGGSVPQERPEVRVGAPDFRKQGGITPEDIRKWEEEQERKPKGEGNYYLGYRAYQEGNYERAEDYFKKAVDLNPRMWQAWAHLGATQYTLQRYGDAEASLRRAIQIEGRYAHAHYNLALVYDRRGEKEKALRAARRAVELDKTDLDAVRLLHHLKQK
jgi:tetratricopeptide (TPR) repeat protein